MIVCLIVLGVIENWNHNLRLSHIPIRIHVNGTRGKSSVTRLIASALRSNGFTVLAKTTGTLPRIILPNGKEIPIIRKSRPNIIEQRDIIYLAAKYNVDAIVIECMALQPYLQWISESKLIQATHTLITNIREDHMDIMGPNIIDVARCLASSTPINGVCILGEANFQSIFQKSTKDRNSLLILTEEQDYKEAELIHHQINKYIEHVENIAIAWRLLSLLKLENDLSRNGLINTEPDPGAFKIFELDYFGRKLHFANGFASNDPTSTKKIFDLSKFLVPNTKKIILLVNLREDRSDRSKQLAKEISLWEGVSSIFLLGQGSNLFVRACSNELIERTEISIFEDPSAIQIIESVLSEIKEECLIIGIGNIAGIGLEIIDFFKNRQQGILAN